MFAPESRPCDVGIRWFGWPDGVSPAPANRSRTTAVVRSSLVARIHRSCLEKVALLLIAVLIEMR